MAETDMVCLANSRKYGGRCVAGLRLDGGGWIRPVSHYEHGTLLWQHYTLANGQEAAILDIIRVPLAEPASEPFQPENWRLTAGRSQLVGRADDSVVRGVLLPALDAGPRLFGNSLDSLGADNPPPSSSLALVEPLSIHWRIRTRYTGSRQTRARFQFSGSHYDLVVTDPRWEERLSVLEYGDHPASAAGLSDQDRVLFCVSLGEPLETNNRRYKLVAGVIVLSA
jgi:hypothetical protein